MPVRKEYTPEFRDQAVRFVFEEIGLDESQSARQRQVAAVFGVNEDPDL